MEDYLQAYRDAGIVGRDESWHLAKSESESVCYLTTNILLKIRNHIFLWPSAISIAECGLLK